MFQFITNFRMVGNKLKSIGLFLFAVGFIFFFQLQSGKAQAAPVAVGVAIQDFQLVSEKVGWVLIEGQLFWTENSGNSWSEITPSIENIQKVYFVKNFFILKISISYSKDPFL